MGSGASKDHCKPAGDGKMLAGKFLQIGVWLLISSKVWQQTGRFLSTCSFFCFEISLSSLPAEFYIAGIFRLSGIHPLPGWPALPVHLSSCAHRFGRGSGQPRDTQNWNTGIGLQDASKKRRCPPLPETSRLPICSLASVSSHKRLRLTRRGGKGEGLVQSGPGSSPSAREVSVPFGICF